MPNRRAAPRLTPSRGGIGTPDLSIRNRTLFLLGTTKMKAHSTPRTSRRSAKGFASSPDEPYIYGAMLAGWHFGKRLGLKGLSFSLPHYEATFWGHEGDPSKKNDE